MHIYSKVARLVLIVCSHAFLTFACGAPCAFAAVPQIAAIANASASQGTYYKKTPSLTAGKNVRWTKEFGPDDAVVDPNTGAVSWAIPSDLPREAFHLGVRATNAEGSTYLTWTLKVGGGKYIYVGPAETCKTIGAGTATASAGDTIVVRDGTYTGSANMVNNTGGGRGTLPPQGSTGVYTTLMAEHPGGAVIDGGGTDYPIYINGSYADRSGHHFTPCPGSYIAIKGFVARNSGKDGNSAGAIEANHADHIKIVDCGACDSHADAAPIYIARSAYMLVEGCYSWGYGRYQILFYVCDYSVMRRNVSRMDVANDHEPIGTFMIYACQHTRAMNNIAIDSDQYANGKYVNFTNVIGAFGDQGGSANGKAWAMHLDNIHAYSIALNIDGKITLTQKSDNSEPVTMQNLVGWDIRAIPNDSTQNIASPQILTPDKLNIDQCTFGHWRSPYYPLLKASGTTIPETVDGWASTQNITNSIFYDFRDYDNSAAGVFDSIERAENNNVFKTGPINIKNSHVSNTITSDPMASCLKYLPRIEAGCALETGGLSGARVGARIMHMRGKSGALWGELDFDSPTAIPMWPFPHEALIKAKMAAYVFHNGKPAGARGFCATGQTLTNYIWGYLGNTVPPFDVTATADKGKVYIAWNPPAAVDRPDIQQYHVYQLTNGKYIRKATVNAANSSSASIGGLTTGRTYTFVVTAKSKTKGESGYSYAVSAAPLSPGP